MRAIIEKRGEDAMVRIPAMVLRAAGFSPGQTVDVCAERGRIVITPLGAHNYELADLVDRITPENCHAEVVFGRPVGREGL